MVVGGGIVGLAAAIASRRVGWRVSVLERAAGFGEVRAGLSLWPNALRAVGAVETAVRVRDRSGRLLSRLDNAEIVRRHGLPLVVVRRAELIRVWAEALPAECLRSGAEVVGVRPDGHAVVVEHSGGAVVRTPRSTPWTASRSSWTWWTTWARSPVAR